MLTLMVTVHCVVVVLSQPVQLLKLLLPEVLGAVRVTKVVMA